MPGLITLDRPKLIRPAAPYLSRAHVRDIMRQMRKEERAGLTPGGIGLIAGTTSASVSLAANPEGINSDQITMTAGANRTAGALLITIATNFSLTIPDVPATSGSFLSSLGTWSANSNAGRVSAGIIPGAWDGVLDGDGTRIAAAVLLNATATANFVSTTAEGSGASFPFPTITPTGSKFLWRFYYGAQDEVLPVVASATANHVCFGTGFGGSLISFAYQSLSSGWTAANGSRVLYDYMASAGGSAA